MARKRYNPEEIVMKLRQVDVLLSQGHGVADAIRQIGVSEVTFYRWRLEYGYRSDLRRQVAGAAVRCLNTGTSEGGGVVPLEPADPALSMRGPGKIKADEGGHARFVVWCRSVGRSATEQHALRSFVSRPPQSLQATPARTQLAPPTLGRPCRGVSSSPGSAFNSPNCVIARRRQRTWASVPHSAETTEEASGGACGHKPLDESPGRPVEG